MEIDYIELMQSNFTTYRIYNDNILEFNYSIRPMPVDCSLIGGEVDQNIVLVNSMLLVIDDYTKIISLDNEEDYNPSRKDLSQIFIFYKDGSVNSYYINLSSENKNENQKCVLQDNRLYITIEENF